jgi:hypothetical protein
MDSIEKAISKKRLQDQGQDDLLSNSSADERVAMMWQLTVDAWTFMGVPIEPGFPRHVVRVVRRER